MSLLDELINNVKITVEIEASGFVMQVGTSLAFIEHFQRFDWFNVKQSGQFHCDGTDTIAQDDFLNNR